MGVVKQVAAKLKRIKNYVFPTVLWKLAVRKDVRVEIHSTASERDIALYAGSGDDRARVMLTAGEAQILSEILAQTSKPNREKLLREGFKR